jgi:hypothetical protein
LPSGNPSSRLPAFMPIDDELGRHSLMRRSNRLAISIPSS